MTKNELIENLAKGFGLDLPEKGTDGGYDYYHWNARFLIATLGDVLDLLMNCCDD